CFFVDVFVVFNSFSPIPAFGVTVEAREEVPLDVGRLRPQDAVHHAVANRAVPAGAGTPVNHSSHRRPSAAAVTSAWTCAVSSGSSLTLCPSRAMGAGLINAWPRAYQ